MKEIFDKQPSRVRLNNFLARFSEENICTISQNSIFFLFLYHSLGRLKTVQSKFLDLNSSDIDDIIRFTDIVVDIENKNSIRLFNIIVCNLFSFPHIGDLIHNLTNNQLLEYLDIILGDLNYFSFIISREGLKDLLKRYNIELLD